MVHTKKILEKKKKACSACHPPPPHQPQWAGPHSILPELPLLQHFPRHEEMVSECVGLSQWIVSSQGLELADSVQFPRAQNQAKRINEPSGEKKCSAEVN